MALVMTVRARSPNPRGRGKKIMETTSVGKPISPRRNLSGRNPASRITNNSSTYYHKGTIDEIRMLIEECEEDLNH